MAVTIHIDMKQPNPAWLHNWANANDAFRLLWDQVIELFYLTTNGKMHGIKGHLEYYITFENDIDCTMCILKWA